MKKIEEILLLDKENDLPLDEESFYDMLDENYNPKDWDISVKNIEPSIAPQTPSEISEPDITFGGEVDKPKINRLVYTKRDG